MRRSNRSRKLVQLALAGQDKKIVLEDPRQNTERTSAKVVGGGIFDILPGGALEAIPSNTTSSKENALQSELTHSTPKAAVLVLPGEGNIIYTEPLLEKSIEPIILELPLSPGPDEIEALFSGSIVSQRVITSSHNSSQAVITSEPDPSQEVFTPPSKGSTSSDKRNRTRQASNSPVKKRARHESLWTYYLKVGGEQTRICKQMFMRTLCICDSWIDSAYSHINPDKGFTVSPSNRVIQITPDKIDSVKRHINLLPRVPSHYCRKRTKREYVQRGVSINKMAKLYLEWAAENDIPQISIAGKRQYRDILNANFNIGFFEPKKDQCSFCCVMRNKNNTRDIREERKVRWLKHLENRRKARVLKEKDRVDAMKDKTIAVCSFDLQKQLTCPKSEASAVYYHSKLNVYNFTVFNHVQRLGSCFLWHEGVGEKGSSEISSALRLLITDIVKSGHTDIRFYSDDCAGQNKNRFLFTMYLHFCVKYSIRITHRYLEPGHTLMAADSIHGSIERSTEKKDIYDFDDWVNAIEETKEELPKYKVGCLDYNSIVSYRDLVPMQNWEVDLQRKPITWTKVKEIFINGQEGLERLKSDFESEGYVTMSPNKIGRPVNLKTYEPPLAYPSHMPLSANTIKGLNALLDGLHIPLQKQTFLRNVLNGVYPVEEEEVLDLEFDSDEEICLREEDQENETSGENNDTDGDENL